MILGENGEKMSKSRGNVVNPDDIVNEYGADTMRLYEMFIGDFEKSAPWSQDGIKGCSRFVERVWNLNKIISDESGITSNLEKSIHKTIKKVSSDIEQLKFNTAIAAIMALLNDITKCGKITKDELKIVILLLTSHGQVLKQESVL